MAEYIEREAFVEQKRKQYCEDCDRRKGMKNGKYKTLYEIGEAPCRACGMDDMLNDVEDFPAADVVPMDFHERCLRIEIQKRMALEKADVREVVYCKDCRHRDPEDHKCDCGGTERQGCPFKVADDYFCAYGER